MVVKEITGPAERRGDDRAPRLNAYVKPVLSGMIAPFEHQRLSRNFDASGATGISV
jgi:hypothetical protein